MSASDTRSLLDNTLQAGQYGLCPVVTADDDLGVQGKHHELLVAAFMYQGRDNIREKHSSVPIIMLRCWPDPSLVKGVSISAQPTGCKEQGVIRTKKQQYNKWRHHHARNMV